MLFLLDSFSVGTIVVDETGKVLIINHMAQEITDRKDGLLLLHGRLAAGVSADTLALRQAIATVSEASRVGKPASPVILALTRQDAHRKLIVSVHPLRGGGAGRPVSHGAYTVICDPDRANSLRPDWLRSLYGLTPTEARLAAELAKGNSIEDAANDLRITIGTARVHLKHIFSKTGTNRQSELIRLLLNSGMGLFI
ncbi:MAG TPA: helix-turn-helix transcriptional regulator [Azospirillum sp.]|nr:helix-turn-helix transcriptional regulator [Azospirillum sp.]